MPGVWSLVGASGGLALGLGRSGGIRGVIAGLVGGLIGGIIGAGLYEVVYAIAFSLSGTSQPLASSIPARFVAHVSVDFLAALGVVFALSTTPRNNESKAS
jgi:hypothetical protein